MAFEDVRQRMVRDQLQARGIDDPRVLAAFLKVPRHLFVPAEAVERAYEDHPIPIGARQTISQPYMVGLMTQLLRLQGHERVLEIGTGSGYQLAILAELALEVYSVERVPELAEQALRRVEALGYLNVKMTSEHGAIGWPEFGPYDGIVVTAAAPRVPPALLDQLADGGRLVIPVGPQDAQMLLRLEREGQAVHTEQITRCVFVPLIGDYGWPEDPRRA
jgi:protein-L-isoaspartate(D-aspartate) O-methyltransferase